MANKKRVIDNKPRTCADCDKSNLPPKQTRGARDGRWLCVSCWEQVYQRPAPDESQERVAKL